MTIEKTKVVEALSKVMDPVSGQDIITLNMVLNLEVVDQNINFSIELPNLAYPSKQELNFACIQALQELYPSANVNVHLVAKGGGRTNTAPTNAVPQVKNIIAVASGKGGVGKSTIAVNLALGLQKLGARVGLIDADLYGPSIPTMLGLQGQRPKVKEIYGKPRIVPLEAHGISTSSIGFIIEPEQAVVLRGPRLSAIIKQFFQDCLWPELDYLIVDLPPGTGDIQLSLVQTVPVTGVVLVTTPQEVALVDAIKAMNMFLLPNVSVPILGVVENMSWFTPADLPDHRSYLFGKGGGGKLAKESKSMLLGQVPLVQAVREGGDAGQPIVLQDANPAAEALLRVAKNTIQQVALRHEVLAPTQRVRMD